jgi:hypothetical protein
MCNESATWRTDVRLKYTGDPGAPRYREWTHREIWDLITLNGTAADPRKVPLIVEDLDTVADYVAEGAQYRPEYPDLFRQWGQLIEDEEDERAIVDRDAEMALLASEFDNVDDMNAPYAESASDGEPGGL